MSAINKTLALPVRGRPGRIALFSLFDLARQRRALARMDDARLADLGLSREDAMAEAKRPVWDVPAHWHK
ncbi:DUF1127 domain-containing protein [Roseovarius faecimaris]|uniref:DUF1127 domain-containing protein n=1 Tax=Roseovarius faecimaris TaxID=2494550 RepID=A0A6I6J247_9RHOB|nr:DUF1127 domain-containing protein [Roseovarius faecimaris]QGX98838.1 DUF1127 domain-containing protein [Roseovarius faecimaris]